MTVDGTPPPVVDDRGGSRLVVEEGGDEAELVYEVDGGRLLLLHTGVPEAFRGQGVGGRLVQAALDKALVDDLVVVPWCPYARRWLHEHPDSVGKARIDFQTPPPEQ